MDLFNIDMPFVRTWLTSGCWIPLLSYCRRWEGDLNLITNGVEKWGPSAKMNPMNDLFSDFKFEHVELIDIELTSITTTWTNRRKVDEFIGKWLDRFLIKDYFFGIFERYWYGVFPTCGLHHSIIVLELDRAPLHPPPPFKFNPRWLLLPDYINNIMEAW